MNAKEITNNVNVRQVSGGRSAFSKSNDGMILVGSDKQDAAALPPLETQGQQQVGWNEVLVSSADERPGQRPQQIIHSPREHCLAFFREHEIGTVLFLIGVWNNAPYVIMLASAKEVTEGGVALVYIANILPGLLVKASGSYWFDRVSYSMRFYMASACMALAFTSVAFFSFHHKSNGEKVHWSTFAGQLFGVALISAQCSLGEASMLAWAGGKIGSEALTWFASGTGLAGPIGFLYHFTLVDVLGFSLSTTCTLAVMIWAAVYAYLTQNCLQKGENCVTETDLFQDEHLSDNDSSNETDHLTSAPSPSSEADRLFRESEIQGSHLHEVPRMSALERFYLTLSLWPYMIPLFLVYAAEYACQSGAWTAMGFPVDSVTSRAGFYERSNWLYQIGVFISRSSGTLFLISRFFLWLLPGLQIVNLVFFYCTAQYSPPPFWYTPTVLYMTALWTGLLGGAVYVHGYRRVIADIPPVHRELALATVSMAEGLGVLVADVLGLFLQACLYQVHGLPGAVVKCPR